MTPEPSKLKKIKYYSSVAGLYLLTLLFAAAAFKPSSASFFQQKTVAAAPSIVISQALPKKPVTSGRPIRIVIPSLNIDLPVDEGFYNESDGSWTLSGYHAQFAMLSQLANDYSGNTFIYGHNNPYVFEHLNRIV